MNDVDKRIQQLEVANRKLWSWTTTIGLLLAAQIYYSLAVLGSEKVKPQIRARELVIVDDSGKEVGYFGYRDRPGAYIRLERLKKSGPANRTELDVYGLNCYGSEGTSRVLVSGGGTAGGSGIFIRDAKKQERATLVVSSDRDQDSDFAILSFRDRKEDVRLEMGLAGKDQKCFLRYGRTANDADTVSLIPEK
jgi:hypothetical protein